MEQNIDPNRVLMIEAFLYDTNEMLEVLTGILIHCEKEEEMSEEHINEIFRIMHTVKGSSAMLSYDCITETAHIAEDMFSAIRNNRHKNIDYPKVCDISLKVADYLKEQIVFIEQNTGISSPMPALIENLKEMVVQIGDNRAGGQEADGKVYTVQVMFEKGCMMENIRAYSIVEKLHEICTVISHKPEELLEDNTIAEYIGENGFEIRLRAKNSNEITTFIQKEIFVQAVTLKEEQEKPQIANLQTAMQQMQDNVPLQNVKNNFFNIHVSKLDKLMDLVGELAISQKLSEKAAEDCLEEEDRVFAKSQKLMRELQEAVMALRMVPIAGTFHKMSRVVRDMCKSLHKDAELIFIGEDTEVDKIIADHMGDPLMHIVRNTMDHGIEDNKTRLESGKPVKGSIFLEAKNTGEEVVIKVSDDGKGLDREKILKKAIQKNLISSDRELSDREVYNLILLPGFSTTEQVTEYSGRGVGMDVVHKNIEKMGGSLSIQSEQGKGMSVAIKIPLTLTIINGMEIKAHNTNFIIPTTMIKRFFRLEEMGTVREEEGKEFIMLENSCFPIIRLSHLFSLSSSPQGLETGVFIQVESEQKSVCIFADCFIGEQQVVVKPLPDYFIQFPIRKRGVSGCAILGGDHISLILDINDIIHNEI